MRVELLLLFLVVGIGMYLTRFLPLLWALRREARSGLPGEGGSEPGAGAGTLLPFVGPSVVAALLVVSLLPGGSESGNVTEMIRAGTALVPTLATAVRFGNLGLTVLVGILAYAAISLVV